MAMKDDHLTTEGIDQFLDEAVQTGYVQPGPWPDEVRESLLRLVNAEGDVEKERQIAHALLIEWVKQWNKKVDKYE